MKKIVINDIEWHDAEIQVIKMETQKDSFDTITLVLTSQAFKEDFNCLTISVILNNVFKARFEINMWISGNDVINTVDLHVDSEWITKVRGEYKRKFGPKDMKHLVLYTNSNSKIEFLITEDIYLDI